MEKVQQTDRKTIYNKDNKKQLQAMNKLQNARWVLKDKTWKGASTLLIVFCSLKPTGHQGVERTDNYWCETLKYFLMFYF